jgi:hypothetical protein
MIEGTKGRTFFPEKSPKNVGEFFIILKIILLYLYYCYRAI